MKQDKITDLSQKEKVKKYKLVRGYILSIVFPFAGIIAGYQILNSRKILPDGQLFYIHPDEDRKRGKQIIVLSIVWLCILFILLLFSNRDN